MTPIVSTAILRTQSDARLAALARERHERAFEAIVERYRKPLLRHCRRFLPETRAEDAVQQTFLNAWSALGNGAHIEDLRAWLYRISRNAALDAAKRAGYDYSELSDGLQLTPAPDDEIERRWVVRETLGGMAALPAGQCEALLRTAVEGHSRADIARDMQISEGAVRQLVHRARAALRAAATAVTPMPFATWASGIGSGGGQMGTRVTEMVAEAGAAGGAGVLLKAGSAVVAVGAFAVGTGAELERSPAKREASAEPPRAQATVPAPDEARLAREVAGDRSDRNGARVAETAGEDEPLTARRVDNSGPGSVNSGPGSVESGASSSGPGSGENDLEDNSGPGSTSGSSGGSSGPGSGGDDGGDNSGSGGGGSGSASGGRSGSGSGDGG